MKNLWKNLFIEKDLQLLLKNFNFSYKRFQKNRMMQTIVIFIMITVFSIVMNSPRFIVMALPVSILVYKYKYFALIQFKKNKILMKKRMFPTFVKEILLLVRTNNVYNAFKKEIEYTPEPLKTYVSELISDMDKDKSKKPFDTFSKKMEFEDAMLVMNMLYTFNESSLSKEHLESLELLINKLYNNEMEEFVESKKTKLWIYSNYTILTMLAYTFGMGIFMFLQIFEKVQIVG